MIILLLPAIALRPPIRPLLLLVSLLAGGCASVGVPPSPPDAHYLETDAQAAACGEFFVALDEAVHDAGVVDVQEARINGFPHLRVNRFLAADWRPSPDDERFGAWAFRLLELDRRAREKEMANLPPSAREPILAEEAEPSALDARIESCGERLLQLDLASDQRRDQLFHRARVADAYRGLYRLAGLYPLTSIAFYSGVKGLQEEIRRDFSVPLEAVPVSGHLIRYVPESATSLSSRQVAEILRRAADNPLQIPDPDEEDQRRLLQAFAPVLEIDVAQPADRIGWPSFLSSSRAEVDTQRPVVFTRLSHVRFESKNLLQLNYIFWFPSRPKKGPLDILAGHLDGITWRITLDYDGTPLIYDSMHNCGCYHLFLPTPKLHRRDVGEGYEEPLLSPQVVRPGSGREVLRIANRSHYLQRVFHRSEFDQESVSYALEHYDRLRSLAAAGGRRKSLFGEDSLVRGSERPERWLFWPMGVPSAGAMRQWGHHATAFVGRRHFDEPELISRYFERAPGN